MKTKTRKTEMKECLVIRSNIHLSCKLTFFLSSSDIQLTEKGIKKIKRRSRNWKIGRRPNNIWGQFHQHSTGRFCASTFTSSYWHTEKDIQHWSIFYSVFQGFSKAKFANGGSILSSSQFSIRPQLAQKVKLASKVVKINSKIIILLPKI